MLGEQFMKFGDMLYEKYDKCDSHYIERYLKFINVRIGRKLDGYLEKHHILPKSDFREYEKDQRNLITLTAREHFIAHWIFARAVGGKQWFSINLMAYAENPYQQRKIFNITSRTFDELRTKISEQHSLFVKKYRNEESDSEKKVRVLKWKETQNKKTQEELEISRKKQIETRKKRQTLGLYNKPQQNKVICEVCHKDVHEKYLSRHLKSKKCKETTKKINKQENYECKQTTKKINKQENYECDVCGKKYKKKAWLDRHTCKNIIKKCACCGKEYKHSHRKCVIPKLKKCDKIIPKVTTKKPDTIIPKATTKKHNTSVTKNITKKYECEKCGKRFLKFDSYKEHERKSNCDLNSEEKKSLRSKRYKETMNNRTAEQKALHRKKLSESISEARQSKSEEEKRAHNEKVSKGLLEYYKSDEYDFDVKSENIKRALKCRKY